MFQHLNRTQQYSIHFGFWLVYYVVFSLIWVKEGDYYSSFYLEFIYMPVRIMLSYGLVLYLIPKFFEKNKLLIFFGSYSGVLIIGSLIQRLFYYFFFEGNTSIDNSELLNLNGLVRTVILLNSTALLVGSIKIADLYFNEKRLNAREGDILIELKSNRRIYRVYSSMISHIEGMGNYVVYHLDSGKKIIVYQSLKKSLEVLGASFVRPHKSFIVNKKKVHSYDNEMLEMENGTEIPLSKNINPKEFL